ncbi:hypothetical protein JO972_14945 [Verrucomicrobiaceae bacterium 5K15]|uniref:Uncharacterized protein n=1 Tax=Oceaniferula flava TaxID=2800421 RepID=A0AAE2SDM1_9BACT|nr:hypothetical protein [Oceaniferula flavus]MBK1856265.1 hypothetical protein [Oceaniferula flavus]MBM1137572.1 hypothetical protein [Oceaniferula flavus]
MSDTNTHTAVAPAPKPMQPPISLKELTPDEPAAEEPAAAAEPDQKHLKIREHLQPLYDRSELLGFAVCDDEGEVLYNETFLSHEAASKTAKLFLSNCQQMHESGRNVYRMTVEMDDVIVIYHCLNEGQGLFILASDCELDAAAQRIAKLAE